MQTHDYDCVPGPDNTFHTSQARSRYRWHWLRNKSEQWTRELAEYDLQQTSIPVPNLATDLIKWCAYWAVIWARTHPGIAGGLCTALLVWSGWTVAYGALGYRAYRYPALSVYAHYWQQPAVVQPTVDDQTQRMIDQAAGQITLSPLEDMRLPIPGAR